MSAAGQPTTPEEAWVEVYAWLPEAMDHQLRQTMRFQRAVLEHPSGPEYRMLRKRVMEGAALHGYEMWLPANSSATRFHTEAAEECADQLVYLTRYAAELELLEAQVRVRQGIVTNGRGAS